MFWKAFRFLFFGRTLVQRDISNTFGKIGGKVWDPNIGSTEPIQVSEAISAQLGYQSEEQARERVVQTLLTFTTSWPREPNHGFLVHFSNRNFEALSEFSTIDTAELVLGAMFAGT